MGNVRVRFKKLRPGAEAPAAGSAGAAGADLRACLAESRTIAPGETQFLPTGIAVEIPAGYAGLVFGRSGLACKRGLAPANKVGVVDCDYRGEILVALHNHGAEAQSVAPGERIAQLVIVPYLSAAYEETAELDGTERGAGGFGSTGRL